MFKEGQTASVMIDINNDSDTESELDSGLQPDLQSAVGFQNADPVTIKQAIGWARQLLTASGIESAATDAEQLLLSVLQVERSYLFARADAVVSAEQLLTFKSLLIRRCAQEPLAYILGVAGFWNLELTVSPAVLIPRPETEILVEQALQRLPQQHLSVVDLGTGSGAIALALASEKPQWQVFAVDKSSAALAIAKINADNLQLSQVVLQQASWLEGFTENTLDAVLANPPYIAGHDEHLLKDGLPHEPQTALVAEDEGYADLFTIAKQACRCLKPGGVLMMEHGYQQADKLADYFQAQGYENIETVRDLAGLDRVTLAYKSVATRVE